MNQIANTEEPVDNEPEQRGSKKQSNLIVGGSSNPRRLVLPCLKRLRVLSQPNDRSLYHEATLS